MFGQSSALWWWLCVWPPHCFYKYVHFHEKTDRKCRQSVSMAVWADWQRACMSKERFSDKNASSVLRSLVYLWPRSLVKLFFFLDELQIWSVAENNQRCHLSWTWVSWRSNYLYFMMTLNVTLLRLTASKNGAEWHLTMNDLSFLCKMFCYSTSW